MKLSLIAGLAGAMLMTSGCADSSSHYTPLATMPSTILETRVYPLLKDRSGSEVIAAKNIAFFQVTFLVKKGVLDQKFLDADENAWVAVQDGDGMLILTTSQAGHAQFEAVLRSLQYEESKSISGK